MTISLFTPELRANFRALYADIFWFGVLSGSTLAFLAIYATRQGASSLQVSLLTAGPAVVNLLFSLPAGRWLEGRSFTRVSFHTSILQRLGFLLLVPLPGLLAPEAGVWAIVWITLAMSIPATLLAVSFNAMFAEVVPPEWRGPVVGRRNALLALSMSTTSLLCGQLLDRLEHPLNYQLVFGLGALGALLSSYYLGRVRRANPAPAPRVGRTIGDLAGPGSLRFLGGIRAVPGLRFLTRSAGKPLLRLDLLRGPFGKFLVAYLLFYTFQFMPLPLIPLYNVRVLNLSDGELSLGAALFSLMTMLASLGMVRVRASYRTWLVLGGLLFGHFPLLLYLARGAFLYWVAMLTGGAVWAVLNAGLINRLMERVPEDDRPAHMTLHNLALNLGILIGSLSGPLLLGWVDLRTAMLLGAGLRLIGGVLLAIWG